MKKKQLLFFATILLFGSGCSVHKEEKAPPQKVQIVKTPGELIQKNSHQDRLQWEGYYYGKFPCPNCRGVETWLHLARVNNRGEYVFREKFLGLKNRYSDGGLGWNKKGDIAKLFSNKGMEVSFQKDSAYLLDNTNKRKFLVKKVPVFTSKEGVFLLDKSTIQHGSTKGNKTLKFRGIANFNQASKDGYQSLKATYFFNCKKKSYNISRAAYYKNTFAMGKFVNPKTPATQVSSLVHKIAKKYCK